MGGDDGDVLYFWGVPEVEAESSVHIINMYTNIQGWFVLFRASIRFRFAFPYL